MTKDNHSYRILIIEDNPGDLAIVEDLLSDQITDPNTTHAENFKSAAALLAENSFDIILLDLTLPDKSGKALIDAMLHTTTCPVIILTGYADINFSINSISSGVFDYLVKDDLTAAMLYKSIIYAIERKKNISALIASEKRYSDLFHLSPQAMWVFDALTLQFLQVNKAATDLYGYSEEEFLTMKLPDLRAKNDPMKTADIEKIRDAKYTFMKTEVHHQKKSGEIIDAEIYSTPIMTENNLQRLGISNDVTAKKRHEHMITRAIIKTQEDERYEIGSELHDNVCQLLATSQMSFGMMRDAVTPEKMPAFLQGREYITMALNEIRDLSHRLAPAFLDNSTLEEAFSKLLGAFNVSGNYIISMHFHPQIRRQIIGDDIQLNLYRILQEQLRNILKYASASRIRIEVTLNNDDLLMTIADNGIGFDTDDIKEGIGLANMRRRAELFSGKCTISSSPGNGCELKIDIPLSKNMH